jgi:cell wall assembly regulator SMI1
MLKLSLTLAAPVLVAVLSGCPRPTGTETMGDSTFVATMVALRRIEADSLMDSTARDSARTVVLRHHGVTAGELEQAARAMAEDLDHASAVWREIAKQSTTRPASTPPSRPAKPAPAPAPASGRGGSAPPR